MVYELWIIPDCPNSAPALALYRRALAAEGAGGDVRLVELTSDEQAESLRFHGSPSFIAEGNDLFPSPASPALACRIYRGHATFAGMPSQADLQAAIRSKLSTA
jgi:hypothetical protein